MLSAPFLPDWMPWWLQLILLIGGILAGLAYLVMPFSVFGLKARLDGIDDRLDEIQADIRNLIARLPEPGVDPRYIEPAVARAAAQMPLSPPPGPAVPSAGGFVPPVMPPVAEPPGRNTWAAPDWQASRQEAMRPEPLRPEPLRPEPLRPEALRPERLRPEPARPEPARPDTRPDTLRPDPLRPDILRQDAAGDARRPPPLRAEPRDPAAPPRDPLGRAEPRLR